MLAAYEPDPELLAIQLRSIRDQTRRDFRCFIGADGDQGGVRALVCGIVGDDPRFEVIGWDDNVGFYLNFERLLMAVPEDVSWVALSDQDDRWYPDKLEHLVPLLDQATLATGQACAFNVGHREKAHEFTRRRSVSAKDLLIQNQVTGAMSVFRRELLDVALPFPRHHGITQLHDHWLAMCAVTSAGYLVLDEVVQDYVQHGRNVVGEGGSWAAQSRQSINRLRRSARERSQPTGIVTALRGATIGWRMIVLDTLVARDQDLGRVGVPNLWLDPQRRRLSAGAMALRGLRSHDVQGRVAVPIAAGAFVEAVSPPLHAPAVCPARPGLDYGSRVPASDQEASRPKPAVAPDVALPLHVGRPNLGSRELFDSYVDRIYDSHWLTNDGPLVRELEDAIAARVGVRHCVAMCNGTIALEIAIRAAGLTGEVIVPSFTFVATAHALHWQGLTPVFADINPLTHTLDPASVEAAVTDQTTGIIAVHLWGRAAPVPELEDIARRHGLTLMFDAAHAFDCTAQGRPIGRNGLAEVFSFHATKFFNTFEGGAIVTDDDQLADRARLMRNFGFSGYDNVIYPGTNGKMPEIAAAMGLTNLPELPRVVEGNRVTFERYVDALSDVPGISLLGPDPGEASNHQYVVAIVEAGAELRDSIVGALHAHGVLARRYFWPGVHRMQPYASLHGSPSLDLPNTDWAAERVLVLPAGPSLSEDQISYVASLIKEAIS